jgi:hypothetical protein
MRELQALVTSSVVFPMRTYLVKEWMIRPSVSSVAVHHQNKCLGRCLHHTNMIVRAYTNTAGPFSLKTLLVGMYMSLELDEDDFATTWKSTA